MPTEDYISKVTAWAAGPFSLADSHRQSPSSSRPKLDVVTNLNIAEGSMQRFTALLREEVEVIARAARATHAFYFGTWDHQSHSGSNRYTALLTEVVYGTGPTDQRLIRVVR